MLGAPSAHNNIIRGRPEQSTPPTLKPDLCKRLRESKPLIGLIIQENTHPVNNNPRSGR